MIQSLTTGLAGSALLPFSGFSPLSQANDPSSGSEKKHKKRLIIDTDPSVDDALAILASLGAEEAEVLVELNDPERLGATLGEPSSNGNVEVVADFEYDAFIGRFFERMEKLHEVFQPK